MMDLFKDFISEMLSFSIGFGLGSLTVYITFIIKRHKHVGNNISQNGSVSGENINAPINITNKH